MVFASPHGHQLEACLAISDCRVSYPPMAGGGFLPKYSPDLNPIEQLFAKLKHLLRKAAARTTDAVCQAIGRTLETFTPQQCLNYFQNSGYART